MVLWLFRIFGFIFSNALSPSSILLAIVERIPWSDIIIRFATAVSDRIIPKVDPSETRPRVKKTKAKEEPKSGEGVTKGGESKEKPRDPSTNEDALSDSDSDSDSDTEVEGKTGEALAKAQAKKLLLQKQSYKMTKSITEKFFWYFVYILGIWAAFYVLGIVVNVSNGMSDAAKVSSLTESKTGEDFKWCKSINYETNVTVPEKIRTDCEAIRALVNKPNFAYWTHVYNYAYARQHNFGLFAIEALMSDINHKAKTGWVKIGISAIGILFVTVSTTIPLYDFFIGNERIPTSDQVVDPIPPLIQDNGKASPVENKTAPADIPVRERGSFKRERGKEKEG